MKEDHFHHNTVYFCTQFHNHSSQIPQIFYKHLYLYYYKTNTVICF
uniref:Uncharacterized protein n=1 Tax=Anguilla anguilla TaxID=7936 RepID=A0A0E9VZZ2_ANGAN